MALGAFAASDEAARRVRVYRRISWRLLPFLFACFLAAYLDRVNVGFAKLQMADELHLSNGVYGLGAGLFFLSYAACEVPSNLLLHRVGARRWLARIMVSWAAVSALSALVRTPAEFYLSRFLLGIAEAGFAPGVLLYLTTWFPAVRRARAVALFFTAIAAAGAIGAPLSGGIMAAMNGVGGIGGWRWLFVIEAVPALVTGILAFRLLPDRPEAASWLSAAEKRLVRDDLLADEASRGMHGSVGAFLRDRRLWLLCVIYVAVVMGQYAITFWLPTIVKQAGIGDPLSNGLVTAIPFVVTIAAMMALGRSADRRRTRRLHLMLPMAVGAAALVAAPAAYGHLALSMVLLSAAAAGLMGATPMFWPLPPAFLRGFWAAAGIAAINAVGNLGGFLSPFLIGRVVDATGSLPAGLYAIAAIELVGMALVLGIRGHEVNR
ncbi:MAG: MFS transporter [Gluconacetobacter diazotrophicus]|nr:MFS transporter [Gluconacetobacter diazotrophicus]